MSVDQDSIFRRSLCLVSDFLTRFIPGFPPDDYYLFDIETTGLDPSADFIVQISWIKSRSGRLSLDNAKHAIVSWEGIVDDDFMEEKINQMRASMESRGKTTDITMEKLRMEGLHPRDSLCLFIQDLEEEPLPVVAHNGYHFDWRFYRIALHHYCGVIPKVPVHIIDTGLIYLAAYTGLHPDYTNLDDFYSSVYRSCRSCTRWSLEYLCFDRFGLDRRYPIRRDKLHDAFTDVLALQALYEHMKDLIKHEATLGY